jgi:gamma-glutamyltranspeptidase / glutathione hydrolase
MRRSIFLLCGLAILASHLGLAQKRREMPGRYASRGLRGAIATGSEYASSAGMRILQANGTAIDAGVTAVFAAAVTEISHFGFGGEAPILVRTKAGDVKSIAGVGTMPKLATLKMFRDRPLASWEIGQVEEGGMEPFIPVYGIMPALVPGMVESCLVTLRDFGTISFEQAITPAIELADGFPVDETRVSSLRWTQRYLQPWEDSKRVFKYGKAWLPGEILRQPDLAATLRAMVEAEKKAKSDGKSRAEAINAVRDYFYRGEIARKIDIFSKANNGLLRYEDFAAFKVEPEDAVAVTYRGNQVYKAGFWSQGPSLLQSLQILEGFDLRSMGFNSAPYLHTVTEALKLAYADRDTYYGDPRFNKISTEKLLEASYAAQRRTQIGERASLTFNPGTLAGVTAKHPAASPVAKYKLDDALAAKDTTCVNVIDKDGNMFSATPSGAWLPSVIAGDTGIPLTQRAQSFLLIDGHPNVLAGGKRPRVTLSPTLVTRNGQPLMVLSTPGGDNQDQALLQLFLNVVEFNMNAEQAVEAPRLQTRHLVSSFDNHAMSPGDLLLDDRIPDDVFQALGTKGHKVDRRTRWSSGAAPVLIRVTPEGVIEAGADPFGYRHSAAW